MKGNTESFAKGEVRIRASFEKTLIVITDVKKNVVSWTSCDKDKVEEGVREVTRIAVEHGVRKVHVRVMGPGKGRETAIRVMKEEGLEIITIHDTTPIPHNGCRPPKRAKFVDR